MLHFWIIVALIFQAESSVDSILYENFRFNIGNLNKSLPKLGVCVNRANATHSFGCKSAKNARGRAVVLKNRSQLERVFYGEYPKAVVLVDVEDSAIIQAILDNRNNLNEFIRGIVFYRNETAGSKDAGKAKLSSQTGSPWQGRDKSFLHHEWPYPIVYLRNNTKAALEGLVGCAKIANCWIDIQIESKSIDDSLRCQLEAAHPLISLIFFKQQHCLELHSLNVLGILLPTNRWFRGSDRSVIYVTARLDTETIFHNWSPGTNSVYSGVAVLHGIAKYLSLYREEIRKFSDSSSIKNVVFALFDGENQQWLGSSSWLYYTMHHVPKLDSAFFSFDTSKVHSIIELGQFLNSNTLHLYSGDKNRKFLRESFKNMSTFAKKVKMFPDISLPESSTIHSFKQFDKNIQSLYVTAAENHQFDALHKSIFDDPEHNRNRQSVTQLRKFSETIGKLILSKIGIKKIDKKLPKEDMKFFYNCYIEGNSTCVLDAGYKLYKSPANVSKIDFVNAPTSKTYFVRRQDLIELHNDLQFQRSLHTKQAIQRLLAVALIEELSYKEFFRHSPSIGFIQNLAIFSKNQTHFGIAQVRLDEFTSPIFNSLIRENPRMLNFTNSNPQIQFSTTTETRYDPTVVLRTFISIDDSSHIFPRIVWIVFGVLASFLPFYLFFGRHRIVEKKPRINLVQISKKKQIFKTFKLKSSPLNVSYSSVNPR